MNNATNTANPMVYGILKEKALQLRKYPTEAESVLWTMLRGKQLGVTFRRQYIIDGYIVDFVCLPEKLIIEVDGGYHQTSEQKEWDTQRENVLKQIGFHILRFTNEEVLFTPDNVVENIKYKLNKQ